MNRHLQELDVSRWDAYLAHHVSVPGPEAHGSEKCSNRVLQPEMRVGGLRRMTPAWFARKDICAVTMGFGWFLRIASVISWKLRPQLLALTSWLTQVCHHLNPQLSFWATTFPARHKGACASVVSHRLQAGSVIVERSTVVKDSVSRSDLEWLSHVLALCQFLVVLWFTLEFLVHLSGVVRISRQLTTATLSGTKSLADRGRKDLSRARLHQNFTCACKRHVLMEQVLGHFPTSTAETHALEH
eukprot:4634204-Amphidinium_carterae.1